MLLDCEAAQHHPDSDSAAEPQALSRRPVEQGHTSLGFSICGQVPTRRNSLDEDRVPQSDRETSQR